jgi:hypothetical protein
LITALRTGVALVLMTQMLLFGGPMTGLAVAADPAPAETTRPGAAVSTTDTAAHREMLIGHLVARGMPRPQAELTVGALTDEDIQVLAENPEMLVSAGSSNAFYWAVFIAIIALGVGLIAAAQ